MRLVKLSLLGILISIVPASAQEANITAEEFEAQLGYQSGTVTLPDEVATINVPSDFRYIGKEGSQRLLTEAWGNPAEASANVIGMLVPQEPSPLADDGWGIIITFDDGGYVNDDDAGSINYDKLLEQMRDDTKTSNEERQRLGYETVTLIGWAEPPHYDATAHKLFWAKELKFGDEPAHTLNYCIRILGRRGVLELNAVSAMDKLSTIRKNAPNVLASIEFNEGHRYSDFLHGKDKAAQYGVAGLIAGAAAVKVGFFKAALVAILALKKVLIVGVIALFALLRRFLGRRGKATPAQPAS